VQLVAINICVESLNFSPVAREALQYKGLANPAIRSAVVVVLQFLL
jgi:hypothetical protein